MHLVGKFFVADLARNLTHGMKLPHLGKMLVLKQMMRHLLRHKHILEKFTPKNSRYR